MGKVNLLVRLLAVLLWIRLQFAYNSVSVQILKMSDEKAGPSNGPKRFCTVNKYIYVNNLTVSELDELYVDSDEDFYSENEDEYVPEQDSNSESEDDFEQTNFEHLVFEDPQIESEILEPDIGNVNTNDDIQDEACDDNQTENQPVRPSPRPRRADRLPQVKLNEQINLVNLHHTRPNELLDLCQGIADLLIIII
ncbi:hypothetical protein J6590_088517 [Homalodisca vitripennis]|nr:hypothetical protein J6590_101712 [Homalodisca vitripennis]KAG8324586.1 hypothetical protein J6590_088517 [Homalodisca vitripennis]